MRVVKARSNADVLSPVETCYGVCLMCGDPACIGLQQVDVRGGAMFR